MHAITDATKKLLKPLKLSGADRMSLTLDDVGQNFIASIYSERPANGKKQALSSIEAAASAVRGDETQLEALRECYRSVNREEGVDRLSDFLRTCVDPVVATHVRSAITSARADTTRVYPSRIAGRVFPSRVPERKKLKDTLCDWQFGLSDVTVSVIDACWPAGQVLMDEEAELAFKTILANIGVDDEAAVRYADYKHNKVVPAHDLTLHPDKALSAYQQVALCNSLASDGYCLFMEQGTGKTPVVIAKICNEAERVVKNEGRMYRAIIVCPNNVRANWANEVAQFTTLPGQVHVLRGGNVERIKQLTDAMTNEGGSMFTVVVVSYDTLRQSWPVLRAVEWDLAVGDESHYYKNEYTKRYKKMLELRDRSRSRMSLTGTPITNNALDLYCQLEFCGQGYSGFVDWDNFKDFHAVTRQVSPGIESMLSIQNVAFIQERLARKSFIITLKEALPHLPKKTYGIREVEMTGPQKEMYRTVASKIQLEVEADLRSGRPKHMVVKNILVRLLRLAQITSGFAVWDVVVDDDGNVLYPKAVEAIEGTNPKIEELLEIAKERGPNSKILVWACFVADIEAIAKALRDAGEDVVTYYGATSDKDRKEAERRFNCDPGCGWMVGNPGAGGTGLNLLGYPPHGGDACDTNCDQIVYYSQDWSSTKRSQSEARPHRRGTRVPVHVTDLVIPGTVDEDIRHRVMNKQISAIEISDIRDILKSVLGLD